MEAGKRSMWLCAVSLMVLSGCAASQDRAESRDRSEATASVEPRSDPAVSDTTDTRRWDFDDTAVGTVPAGWKLEKTHPRDQDAMWSVTSDPSAPSGERVLALTDTGDSRGSTFNLAWTDEASFLDGTVAVEVKAGGGREDQGGGPMWRVRDANNYYVARWNPLEDNFRLYFVEDGDRVQMETARVHASTDEWHTITIRQRGTHIEALLDGEKLLETVDDTFTGAGGVGVWTKADASSRFDDLAVESDVPGAGSG